MYCDSENARSHGIDLRNLQFSTRTRKPSVKSAEAGPEQQNQKKRKLIATKTPVSKRLKIQNDRTQPISLCDELLCVSGSHTMQWLPMVLPDDWQFERNLLEQSQYSFGIDSASQIRMLEMAEMIF